MEVPLAEDLVAGSPLYVELALFHLCWETWLKVRGLLEVRTHLVWSPMCLVHLEGFLKDIFLVVGRTSSYIWGGRTVRLVPAPLSPSCQGFFPSPEQGKSACVC